MSEKGLVYLHKKRREKLMDKLLKKDINGFIITKPENQYYISGFTGEGLIIITGHENYILTDSRYTEQAKKETSNFTIIETRSGISPFSIGVEIVKEFKLNNIGFECHSLTVKEYDELAAHLKT